MNSRKNQWSVPITQLVWDRGGFLMKQWLSKKYLLEDGMPIAKVADRGSVCPCTQIAFSRSRSAKEVRSWDEA